MRNLRWGALICGLSLAISWFTPVSPARADVPSPVFSATASTATASASAAPAAATSPASTASARPSASASPAATASARPATDSTAEPTATASPEPTATTSATSTAAAPDEATARYIVRFRNGHRPTSADLPAGSGMTRFRALPAVTATLTAQQAASLSRDPDVVYVQPEPRVSIAATETNSPWGLDRIDQAALPLDGSYTATQSAAGVTVYVVDTGINASHSEFAGRVADGFSAVHDGYGTTDCNGHGTHVAATIGGSTFGVAKKVTIVPVRVLNCAGQDEDGYGWTVLGLDWVLSQQKAGTPAVVNLSLAGGYSDALNDAVEHLVAAGVTVVVAAGNYDGDACDVSPASAPDVLTVAATDSSDRRYSESDWGRCVDLYAPGVNVLSANAFGSEPVTMTGTSMATPHVSGSAAMILAAHPTWTPAKVASRIQALSLSGVVGGNHSHTADRLLNIAPVVTSLTPTSGLTDGGTRITIRGKRFVGVQGVQVGEVAATDVRVVSESTIVATVPAAVQGGPTPVTVQTELSTSNLDATFTYIPRPSVSAVSPASGPTGGGTTVTISGHRFTGATAVRFGSVGARSFTVVSDTEITAVTPARSSGTVDVRVTSPDGTSSASKADRFSFGKLPSVSKLSTSRGLTIGGGRITLTGTHLTKDATVLFGDVPGTAVRVSSSTRLAVTVPVHAEGNVEVRVVNRFGGSSPSRHSGFCFSTLPAPTLTKLSPSSGYSVGGTQVTITGRDFAGITSVTFAGAQGTIVSMSSTRLVVIAPSGDVGAAEVRVVGAYGTSTVLPAATFTYLDTPAPVVKKLSPASGRTAGGTKVTITGSGFYAITSVEFGGVPGTDLRVASSTKLTVRTPLHARGNVDVVVVETHLTSDPYCSRARFTYR